MLLKFTSVHRNTYTYYTHLLINSFFSFFARTDTNTHGRHTDAAGSLLIAPTYKGMARLSRPGWLVTHRDKCPVPEIEPGHGHPSKY